jgi:hypothetical protein
VQKKKESKKKVKRKQKLIQYFNMTSEQPKLTKELTSEQVLSYSNRAVKRIQSGKTLKPGQYERYIEYLSQKPTQGSTEKHHKVPKHANGLDVEENLIRISPRDHILAHLIRYLEMGQKGDLQAYSFRKATGHIDLSSQGKRIAFMNKLNKRCFWDSEFQREMGKRGGSKGGSRNTFAQFQARQKVGLKYGRSMGITNQNSKTKELIQNNTIVFVHNRKPDFNFYVGPCLAVVDLARELNDLCDEVGAPELKLDPSKLNGGHFYSLVKQVRKMHKGWTIKEFIPIALDDD